MISNQTKHQCREHQAALVCSRRLYKSQTPQLHALLLNSPKMNTRWNGPSNIDIYWSKYHSSAQQCVSQFHNIHLSARQRCQAFILSRSSNQPPLCVHCGAKLCLQTACSHQWAKAHLQICACTCTLCLSVSLCLHLSLFLTHACTHTQTHAHTPVYPPWPFSHWGNLVKLCPSLHAEQGITTQFSPQRARNQPNPAWDYTLLLTFSSTSPVLSLSGLFLSLNRSFSFPPHIFLSLNPFFCCLPLPSTSFLPPSCFCN